MSFELKIGSRTKLCSEDSSRHSPNVWCLDEMQEFAKVHGIRLPQDQKKNKAALYKAIYNFTTLKEEKKKQGELENLNVAPSSKPPELSNS